MKSLFIISIALFISFSAAAESKDMVVTGKSTYAGPLNMDLERNATVTICHSRTADIPSYVKNVSMNEQPLFFFVECLQWVSVDNDDGIMNEWDDGRDYEVMYT